MKGSSESSSRSLSYTLPKDKHLTWSPDGKTNLSDWKPAFIQAAKGAYPVYAIALVDETIPTAWTSEFDEPDRHEWDAMTPIAQKKVEIKLSNHERVKSEWEACKPAFCTFLLLNISESSEKRALEQHHAEWDTAKKSNDLLKIYSLILSAHSFFGSKASLQEQKLVRVRHDTFSWHSPEDLAQFKYRWDKLIKEVERVGITVDLLPMKERFFAFISALKNYGHSTMVQMSCMMRSATIDSDADYDIERFYDQLVLINRSQHPELNGVPQIKDPTALAAHTIAQQLKGKHGDKRKGDKAKGGDKGQHVAKESGDDNANPATKAYVDKKVKETGQSAKDIRSALKCNKCGKTGHIAPDCKSGGKTAGKSSGKAKKGKNNGNKAASIFSATQQDEAIDNEGYFVPGLGGAFCAICDLEFADDLHIFHDDNTFRALYDQTQDSEDDDVDNSYEAVVAQLEECLAIEPTYNFTACLTHIVNANDDDEPPDLIQDSDDDDEEENTAVPIVAQPISTAQVEVPVIQGRHPLYGLPTSATNTLRPLPTPPDELVNRTLLKTFMEEHENSINREFQDWSRHYRRVASGSTNPYIWDSSLCDSENEFNWQREHWNTIQSSMLGFFQPRDPSTRFVNIVMLWRYTEFRRRLGNYYFFEDVFQETECIMDAIQPRDLSAEAYRIRTELRNHVDLTDTRITLDAARWHATYLTNIGVMNFRFRAPPGDREVDSDILLPRANIQSEEPVSNLKRMRDPDGSSEFDQDTLDRMEYWYPSVPEEYQTREPQWFERGYNDQFWQQHPPDIIPIGNPLGTPPDPPEPGAHMALKPRMKGPRPDCFNYYSLDNHADISIFCNADLLTNIREFKAGVKVSGISDTSVNFTHVGDHPYCGTVIYAPRNRYNLIAMRVIRENGHHYVVDRNNQFYAILDENDRLLVKFDYDPVDHFYKVKADHAFDFMDPNRKAKPPEDNSIALPNAVVEAGEHKYDAVMFFTAEQRRRAALVPPIHIALHHLSDAALVEAVNSPSFMNCPISAEDVANARIIYGPCKECLEGKPLPIKGNNSTGDNEDITAPGQLLHVDVVYISKIPHLFCVDDYSNYMNLIRMQSKRTEDLQQALLALILFYRGHLKVVRTISSDHEAVFISCEQFLQSHGARYRARIPGEHEVNAERGMRTIREAMRVKELELKNDYDLPEPFLSFLAMDCVNTRNFIPNSRSSPRMPEEIVTGDKINFRTDLTAFFGQLVLVKSNNVAPDGVPIQKNEFGIALGRVTNTKGSVWLYRMGHKRIVPRRVVKAVPITEEWREHLNALAKQRPIDPANYFEFRSTLEYGPSDMEPNSEERTERTTVENTVINSRRSQLLPLPIQPTVAESPVPLPPVPSPVYQPPSPSVSKSPAPSSAMPEPQQSPQSPVARRRVSYSGSPPPRPEPHSPVAAPDEDTKVPLLEQKYDGPNWGRGKRVVKAKVYSVHHQPDTSEEHEQSGKDNINDTADPDHNMFVYMGAHDDGWDCVAMQITLEAALKTQYKKQVEDSAVAECKNLLNFKTFKYLKRREDAEKTIHPAMLPCSMVVKDKRDSKGELLLWKSRLATGGHLVDPTSYQPFDKTSPTASMDCVYAVLATMQKNRMSLEVCDVPSAYLNTPLPKGKKHVMRIKPSIAKYFVVADPSAEQYLQQDGSLIVQLEKALYGLPESGKLWHELLRDNLKAAGYIHKPNDTTMWKRCEKNRDGKVVSMSIILVFVDDFMHVWMGPNGGTAVRDKLHKELGKSGLPPLKCSRLTTDNSVSFLGLSIQVIPGFRLFVSQPGYTAALVETYDYKKRQNSPLPPDFNSRTVSVEDQEPLDEEGTTLYRKEIMSIAWLVRTRPNIAAAVAHKQTKCATPNIIDRKDLSYMIGFLANNINAGMVIDCKDGQLYLYVDVGHATHSDMRSHSGALLCMGRLGYGGVPFVWKSLKQKVVSLHSTSAELIGLSDMFDLLQCGAELMAFLQIGQRRPFTVYQDNTSTITIAYMGRSSSHAKRRFIEIRFMWFKEHLDAGFAKLEYLSSADHPADLLASIRSGSEFRHFTSLIMGNI